MKQGVFFIAFLSILAVACRQQSQPHLPPDKMQRLLFDIHLAETYSMTLHEDSTKRNVERNQDSLALFYRSIFKHHQITEKEFDESFDWYKQNPEQLDSIYASMISEMSKLEGFVKK